MKAIDIRTAYKLLERRDEIEGKLADLRERNFSMTLVLNDESGDEIDVINDDDILNSARDQIIDRYGVMRSAIDGELAELGVTGLDDIKEAIAANEAYYGPGGVIDETLSEAAAKIGFHAENPLEL